MGVLLYQQKGTQLAERTQFSTEEQRYTRQDGREELAHIPSVPHNTLRDLLWLLLGSCRLCHFYPLVPWSLLPVQRTKGQHSPHLFLKQQMASVTTSPPYASLESSLGPGTSQSLGIHYRYILIPKLSALHPVQY